MGVRFKAVRFADLKRRPPRAWLVDGLIPAGSLSMLCAPSNAGKSFAALDLAFGIPGGRAWGRSAPTPGPTLYVAGEGEEALHARVAAWEAVNRRPVPAEAVLLEANPNIGDADDRAGVVRAYREQESDADPVLVVVDTLDNCFGEGDENSARDMRRFVRGCKALRADLGRPAVVILHHTGHARNGERRRERGSSGLRGACDLAVFLDRDGYGVSLTFDKVKDGRTPPPVELTLAEADVPGGTSLAVIPADDPAAKLASLTPERRRALAATAAAFGSDWRRRADVERETDLTGGSVDGFLAAALASGLMIDNGETGHARRFAVPPSTLAALAGSENGPGSAGSPGPTEAGSPDLPPESDSAGDR